MEEARRAENEFKCEYCEYSAHNLKNFGKHMHEKHRTGGSNDNKEIVVVMRSISVQTDTDLIKCKECEHSENLKRFMEKHQITPHRIRHGKREGCR